jgi:hypothetical protein
MSSHHDIGITGACERCGRETYDYGHISERHLLSAPRFCSVECRELSQAEAAQARLRQLGLPLAGPPVQDEILTGLIAGAAAAQGVNGPGHPLDGPEAAVLADWLLEQGDPRGTALRFFTAPDLTEDAAYGLAPLYLTWVRQDWLGPLPDGWRCRFDQGWLDLECNLVRQGSSAQPRTPLPPTWVAACREGWIRSLSYSRTWSWPEPLPKGWRLDLQGLTGFRWMGSQLFLDLWRDDGDAPTPESLAGQRWLRLLVVPEGVPLTGLVSLPGLCAVDLRDRQKQTDEELFRLHELPLLRRVNLHPSARISRAGIRRLLDARPGIVLSPPDWETRYPENRAWWKFWG